MKENYLFVEKYRPQSIDDCVLPADLKQTFQRIVDGGEIPNMMFVGSAGVGKTTVAKAICNQLGCDYIMINGSEDGNIDTLRGKIRQFASTISFDGGTKVVILDEADYLNPQSTQPALRGFIEEFSDNCRFILTCNFKNRIIDPIHSRTQVIDFAIPNSQKPEIAAGIFKRVIDVLQNEQIEYDQKAVVSLVQKHFPDFRRILNEIQRYSAVGKIDAGILVNLSEENTSDLISHIKNKNFNEMRKWVAQNMDVESHVLFRRVYELLTDKCQSQSIPQAVLILADYQYKAAFAADQELNTVACFTELMAQVSWK